MVRLSIFICTGIRGEIVFARVNCIFGKGNDYVQPGRHPAHWNVMTGALRKRVRDSSQFHRGCNPLLRVVY